MRPAYDRTTPTISVKVQAPGKKDAERVLLTDLLVTESYARSKNIPFEWVGKSITRLLGWTYEDTEKGADKGKLTINNYDLRFPDDPIFDRGNTLVIAWGYEGALSPEREFTILDWTPGPTFVVEGQLKAARAINIKKNDETWYGRSYSDIAKTLAERAGFAVDAQFIERVPFVPESVVQHTLTDAEFMRKLANEIGYVFFVDISGWHFHPRAFGQTPRKVLEYFTDGSDLGEFPKFDKAPAAQPGSVKLKGIDPITKKPIEAVGDNKTTKGRPGLASFLEVIDPKTAQTELRPLAGKEATVSTSATTPAEAKTKAQGLAKVALGVPVKCSASCTGDPYFQAKSVVELKGIGGRLSGLYYCSAVTHSIEPGKYTMALKLQRDGTNGTGANVGGVKSDAVTNTKTAPAAASNGTQQLEPFEGINGRTGQTSIGHRAAGPKK